GEVEQRPRGTARRVVAGEGGDARHGEVAGAALAGDLHGVADLEIAGLRGLPVDHDLVGRGGRTALDEIPRRLLDADPHPTEAGRAVLADRVAVLGGD